MTPAAPGAPASRGSLLVAAVSAAACCAFLLLPYGANDLYRVPLVDVAGGAHDPKGLWPFDQALVGGVLLLLAYVTMAVAPLASVLAAGWAVADLRRRRDRTGLRRRVPAIATVVLAGAVCTLFLSPLGAALIGWLLD